MSIILGIDTSTTELGIGIVRDGEFVATYTRYIRHSHAEHISRAVSLLLDSSDIAPDEVTHCAVAAGPGSFTGLRIGLSFVKGFGIAGELQVMPCSSLLVLAHAGLPAGGPVIAAIDARRDEVFWALFTASGIVLRRESDDVLSSSSDFRSALPERCIVATDTMGYAASTVFSFLEKQALHRMA
ncbi:MAG: tRNA (adenosine(37)-N6)-threonylcarbamoyltransferase complex dimerization subunit type 1 TsaB, partial [Chitinispirillaceae bacterium]|nr:tRNA (adenosine(37)-N6)-threonylcarbamoyltransferase complex dimerization subunit type 1 TsaB [Chitinispirillaceae bacterium]